MAESAFVNLRNRYLVPRWKRELMKPGNITLPVWLDIADLTWKRYSNLMLLAKEIREGRTVLKSRPSKLVIEATNVCNLHCPGCYTGLGENGRVRSAISLEAYKKVMDELGDTLIEVEFFNWGEPLLCKWVEKMVADAHARGVGTHLTTNFSIPFDEARAEALVRSGLDNLGVSLDGATQEGYEKYRRGGDIELVFRNVRLIADAKKKLGSATPRMVWSFHVFSHNVHEMQTARDTWKERGFDDVDFVKGFTIGDEWHSDQASYFLPDHVPNRCPFLWNQAVIHNDGGVAPCAGTFYHEDDLGRISVRDGDGGAQSFEEVWNSKAFQDTRGLFAKGKKEVDAHLCAGACAECPNAKTWHNFQKHEAAGGTLADFKSGYTSHDGFNYFLTRRPPGRDTKAVLRPNRKRVATTAALTDSET